MQDKAPSRRESNSPQAPRIPKSKDALFLSVLNKLPAEEDKREEHNFFIRRRDIPIADPSSNPRNPPPVKIRPHKPSITKGPSEENSRKTSPKPPEEENKQIYPQRMKNIRPNQPRQKQLKPEKEEHAVNLSNLSNIINEMKDMLGNMPVVNDALNKSTENTVYSKRKFRKSRPSIAQPSPKANVSREKISLHDKSFKNSEKFRPYLMKSKPSKKMLAPRLSSRHSMNRPKSHKSPKALPNIKPKSSIDIEAIQSFFIDFHAKSKLLLGNLERSVLGDNSVCK
ncbi:unnamed protein product [Blepharisma stoltei]|uniref:Uncharacterized protein n=1 Tax=Blepharisma stoltei TaxID=1481888 RepID=A0AAU9JX16_9CILI|nr:unnamed protein product [Blepharisma stoltei]